MWIEWAAESAPTVRAAAEIARPSLVKILVVQADTLALVQRLPGAVATQFAPLEQDHAERLSVELPRQADGGRAAANDANFSFQDGAVGHTACVNNHKLGFLED